MIFRAAWRALTAAVGLLGSALARKVSGRKPDIQTADPEVGSLSDGQLYQAALNIEVIFAARHLGAGDRATLERKLALINTELKRRKLPLLDI